MIDKYKYTFLLIQLTVTSVALSFVLLKPTKRAPKLLPPNTQTQTNALDATMSLKASFWNIYPTLVIPDDDKVLNNNLLLQSTDGKFHKLNDLVGNKPKLVFRYSQLDCDVCVDSVLATLNMITGKKILNNLIIIADFQNERDFKIYEISKKHIYPIYNIAGSHLGLSLEHKNLPFLFILSGKLRVTKLFVPFKEIPYQTQEYIKYAFNYLKK